MVAAILAYLLALGCPDSWPVECEQHRHDAQYQELYR